MILKALVSILTTFLFLPSFLFAADYATIQYTDTYSGTSFIVFQKSEGDEKFCRALNQNFIRGLRTTCPNCVIELQGCDSKLPSSFSNIFDDVPGALPYISAPHMRIVVFGSLQAESICRERAEILKTGMNQDVECIY